MKSTKRIYKRGHVALALSVISAIIFISSCKKYLDVKSDKSLAVPSGLSDYQAILDQKNLNVLYPSGGDISSDNYFLKYATWQSIAFNQHNIYTWQPEAINDQDWQYSYTLIEDANTVLDGLATISGAGTADYNNVKGSAYFYRAFAFYQVANVFTMPYNAATSKNEPGIPLKLTADITAKIVRSNLEDTYQQIISDLKTAAALLPVIPLVKSRPSKPAAFGALARVYLVMGDYQQANAYADSCLKRYDQLLDFNTLNPSSPNPIPLFNNEVIFHATTSGSGGVLSSSRALVDTALYATYDNNDLRKTVFYKANNGYHAFKGDYSGQNFGQLFTGISTDEELLIRAETSVRLGNVSVGIDDLNHLLVTRYVQGTYTPYSGSMSADDALQLILNERRKELAFHGEIRWSDLRRLNQDSRFAKTLTRNLNGTIYTLPPNDDRYALLIPASVVQISGIPQNKR